MIVLKTLAACPCEWVRVVGYDANEERVLGYDAKIPTRMLEFDLNQMVAYNASSFLLGAPVRNALVTSFRVYSPDAQRLGKVLATPPVVARLGQPAEVATGWFRWHLEQGAYEVLAGDDDDDELDLDDQPSFAP